MGRIEVIRDDITKLEVDAIVNAANEGLLGGGGVDGAIHRAAGPRLLEACRAFPQVRNGVRCPAGQCRLTPGFDLPAKFIIHTAGPIWRGGNDGEREMLTDCYRNAMQLAVNAGARTIAFPAISCGVYHFPIDEAATLSVRTISEVINTGAAIERVFLVAFDPPMQAAWNEALQAGPKLDSDSIN